MNGNGIIFISYHVINKEYKFLFLNELKLRIKLDKVNKFYFDFI
jgi:hypothetical protein